MRNIGQLAQMIGDLLVMGRMNGGVVEIRPESIEIRDLIEECAADLPARWPTRRASASRWTLTRSAVPDAWCDPVRTTEVLNNLIDNAVKFTPTGGAVAVSVTPPRAGPARHCAGHRPRRAARESRTDLRTVLSRSR